MSRSFLKTGNAKFSPTPKTTTSSLPIVGSDKPTKIGSRKGFKKPKDDDWGSIIRVFFVSMGAIMVYGLLTNIAFLNNGINTPDPAAHNLAFIISCIVSGAAMAFACFNYTEHNAVYVSPVDAILAYFHSDHQTNMWHTVSRVLGLLAGAFTMSGVLFLVYQDNDRVKLAATVVNPLNLPGNGSAFTAFCLETIGTVVLALATFTLDAQHRRSIDRSLIKGLLVIGLRLAVFQYTTGSFNVFLSLAMNATTDQWSTFASGTYYIYWLSAGVALVASMLIILGQRKVAQMSSEIRRKQLEASKSTQTASFDISRQSVGGSPPAGYEQMQPEQ